MASLGLFMLGFLFSCIFLKVNIGFGIGIGSILVLIMNKMSFTYFLQATYTALDSFPFIAIPAFILAGNLMEHTGISAKLIDWCDALAGRVRGSIGAVTTIAAMAFGLLTGSATSTLSSIGKIMLPEMVKRGYKKSYAAALIASTCFLGYLIPPSGPGIIYALCAGCSITEVWMATVVPGILIGAGTIFLNWFIVGRREPIPEKLEGGLSAYFANLGKQTARSAVALLMPMIIFGGIYSGVFTPTEAGAICILYALVYYIYLAIRQQRLGKSLKAIFDDSNIGTASIGLLTAFSLAMGRVITMCGVSETLAAWILEHCTSKWLFLLLYIIVLLFMGMFMSGNATILILTPLLLPTAEAYGITAVEFGALMLVANAYGGLTPPFATYNFIASGLSDEPFASVTKESMPFLLLGITVIFLMCAVPGSYMWLVNLLKVA